MTCLLINSLIHSFIHSLTNSFNSGTQDICVRHFKVGPLQTASWAVLEWGEIIATRQEPRSRSCMGNIVRLYHIIYYSYKLMSSTNHTSSTHHVPSTHHIIPAHLDPGSMSTYRVLSILPRTKQHPIGGHAAGRLPGTAGWG